MSRVGQPKVNKVKVFLSIFSVYRSPQAKFFTLIPQGQNLFAAQFSFIDILQQLQQQILM